jgi:hypothetical protein
LNKLAKVVAEGQESTKIGQKLTKLKERIDSMDSWKGSVDSKLLAILYAVQSQNTKDKSKDNGKGKGKRQYVQVVESTLSSLSKDPISWSECDVGKDVGLDK